MEFIAKDWDIFVTKNGGKNSTKYDLVAFNSTTETACEDVVDKSKLTGIDSTGNEYKMLEVGRDMFNMIENKLLNKYSLESGFVNCVLETKKERVVEEKEDLVPANLVKKEKTENFFPRNFSRGY